MAVLPEVLALARADHFTPGRSHRIRAIIVHATAGVDSLAWLRYASSPPVSCHVLISKSGVRHRIVHDWDTAWHCGFSTLQLPGVVGVNPNAFTLGLELENRNDGKDPYPRAQLEAAFSQLTTWWGQHGYVPAFRHGDVDTRKWDPAGLNMAALVGGVYRT